MADATFTFLDPGPLRDGELELVLTSKSPPEPDRSWVPAYGFDMRVRRRTVGSINLRVGHSPDLELYAGHIGYNVKVTARGRNYAERACRLLLPLALAHGLDPLWITCNPDNFPSRRTCERLGGVFVEVVALPDYSDMYAAGEREKCRYRIDTAAILSARQTISVRSAS
jgi:predicted acetyltransferase